MHDSTGKRYSLQEILKEYRIVIPLIQRGYAQGRDNREADSIRSQLLSSIKETILSVGQFLSLDYSYGYFEKNDNYIVFYPYDGQQRLTTLFLVYAYLCRKSGHLDDAMGLSHFSYAGRNVSDGYVKLLGMEGNDGLLQNPLIWHQDPSAEAMARTYSQIVKEFESIKDYDNALQMFENITIILQDPCFEQSKEMEESFIKMNSRGRRLTDLEVFKSGLIKLGRENSSLTRYINEFLSSFLSYYEYYFKKAENGSIVEIEKNLMYFVRAYFGFHQELIEAEGERITLEGFVPFSSYKNILEKDIAMLCPFTEFFKYLTDNEMDSILPARKTKRKSISDFSIDEIASIILSFSTSDERRRRIRVCCNLIDNTSMSMERKRILKELSSLPNEIGIYSYLKRKEYKSEDYYLNLQLEEEKEKACFIEDNPCLEERIQEAENFLFFSGKIKGLLGWNWSHKSEDVENLLTKRINNLQKLFENEDNYVPSIKNALYYGMKKGTDCFAKQYLFNFSVEDRTSFWPNLFIEPREEWCDFAFSLMDGTKVEHEDYNKYEDMNYLGLLLEKDSLIKNLSKSKENWSYEWKYGYPVIARSGRNYSYHYMLDGLLIEGKGRLMPSQIFYKIKDQVGNDLETGDWDFSLYPLFQGNGDWREFKYKGEVFYVSVVSGTGYEDGATAVIVHGLSGRNRFVTNSNDVRVFRLIVPDTIEKRVTECIEWMEERVASSNKELP